MIKIYMDESGIHDGSPVVSVGAYCGKPKEWVKWTKAWNVAKRPIKVFHSTDCQNLAGEFKGWTREQADKLVAGLLPVLANHHLVGLGIGINLNDYNDALKDRPELKALFGDPYIACVHWLFSEVIDLMEKTHNNQALAFIHEENDKQGAISSVFYELKKKRTKHRAPMSITFAPKEHVVPLQAADVLAYESNKRGRNPEAPKFRRSLEAMSGTERVSIQGFHKANMPWFASHLDLCAQEIKVFGRVVTFVPPDPKSS